MTKIEWTHRPGTKGESWNPIRARNKETGKVGHYCVKIAPECANCYAERLQGWPLHSGIRYAAQDLDKVDVFLDDATLVEPLHWKKPRTIFVCSQTDLCGDWVPDVWIDRIFAVAALCPHHTFIVLTKRSARLRAYMTRAGLAEAWWEAADRMACAINLPEGHGEPYLNAGKGKTPIPLPNVWLVVSAGTQEAADEHVPNLLATPAAVRGVSIEPLLGPVDLTRYLGYRCKRCHELQVRCACTFATDAAADRANYRGLAWVIVGGESVDRGEEARPYFIEHDLAIARQCRDAGVAFFRKQLGANPSSPLRTDFFDHAALDDLADPNRRYFPMLKDPKGGDWNEWPEELRVREFPA